MLEIVEHDWRIGVVGNIIHEHTLEDGRIVHGTKEFVGGAKVYIGGKNWNNYPRTEICVIGLGRYKKYERAYVSPDLIENVRFQIIRKKVVLAIINSVELLGEWVWYGRTANDKREAKKIVENWESIVLEAKGNKVSVT